MHVEVASDLRAVLVWAVLQVADRCLVRHGAPPASAEEVARWGRDAAAGLRAMHAAGLTHRNLHPRNVHLDSRGRAVLTGFQVLQRAGLLGFAQPQRTTMLQRRGGHGVAQ